MKIVDTIKSFQVDHDLLTPGIYLSREDCGTITYDIRLVKPNSENIPSISALHTVEHIVATYLRNSAYKDQIIYFGPMGCRTGCYLITSDKLLFSDVINLIRSAFFYLSEYTDEIPGSTRKQCGNYLDHDLISAKNLADKFVSVTKNWSITDLKYPESAEAM